MKYLLIVTAVFFLGCKSESTYQDSQLVGKWTKVSWHLEDGQEVSEKPVSFTFNENLGYEANYGRAAAEVGKFSVKDIYLHTIEDGKAEKKVKIARLTADTLVFEMNRTGTLETMVLVKE